MLLCVLFLHLACASKVQLFDKVCSSFLLDRHVRRSRAWDSHLWLFHRLQRCRPQRAHGLCRRLQWSLAAASNIRQLFKHVQLQIYHQFMICKLWFFNIFHLHSFASSAFAFVTLMSWCCTGYSRLTVRSAAKWSGGCGSCWTRWSQRTLLNPQYHSITICVICNICNS